MPKKWMWYRVWWVLGKIVTWIQMYPKISYFYSQRRIQIYMFCDPLLKHFCHFFFVMENDIKIIGVRTAYQQKQRVSRTEPKCTCGRMIFVSLLFFRTLCLPSILQSECFFFSHLLFRIMNILILYSSMNARHPKMLKCQKIACDIKNNLMILE